MINFLAEKINDNLKVLTEMNYENLIKFFSSTFHTFETTYKT